MKRVWVLVKQNGKNQSATRITLKECNIREKVFYALDVRVSGMTFTLLFCSSYRLVIQAWLKWWHQNWQSRESELWGLSQLQQRGACGHGVPTGVAVIGGTALRFALQQGEKLRWFSVRWGPWQWVQELPRAQHVLVGWPHLQQRWQRGEPGWGRAPWMVQMALKWIASGKTSFPH